MHRHTIVTILLLSLTSGNLAWSDDLQERLLAGPQISVDTTQKIYATPPKRSWFQSIINLPRRLLGYLRPSRRSCFTDKKGYMNALLNCQDPASIEQAIIFLKSGAPPKIKVNGVSAMEWVLEKGCSDLYLPLINRGASPNATDSRGETAVFKFIREGKADLLQPLIKADAKLNLTNKKGDTPLDLATQTEDVEATRALLNAGANARLNRTWFKSRPPITFKGQPLLGWAQDNDFFELYVPLVKSGASPDTTDSHGNTVLMKAATRRNVGQINDLLALKANPNRQNESGESALHIAAFAGDNASLTALTRAGGKPTLQDKKGNTPLLSAALGGNFAATQTLLFTAGNNINAVNKDGRNALNIVAEQGQEQIATLLLAMGINANLIDQNQNTALMGAAGSKNASLLKKVLAKTQGSTLTLNNSQGKTAKAIAEELGFSDGVKLIDDAIQEHLDDQQSAREALHGI